MLNNIKGIAVTWLSLTELTNLNSGEGGSNLVDIKKFKFMNQTYPYVSGQAMRAYLRESIRRSLSDTDYMCMPDAKGETCGNVRKCIQCDLFGFMLPKKKKSPKRNNKSDEKSEEDENAEGTAGGAITRISPVKVAPAIGQLPFFENFTLDFLTRRKPQQKVEEKKGDIVNVELGKNLYKCGLDIDVQRVGRVEVIDVAERSLKFTNEIDVNESVFRIRKVLDGIRYLSDYSKQARLLTDFTPDIICIAFQRIYSHRLQKLFDFNPSDGKLNVHRLQDVLSDLLQYSDKIFFGLTNGILFPEVEVQVTDAVTKLGIPLDRPDQAIRSAVDLIKS